MRRGESVAVARLAGRLMAVAGAVAALAGCAKMDAALGQQWIVVQFAPGTSVATVRHITERCAGVPHVRLAAPVRQTTAEPGVVTSIRYAVTNASDADMAQLQGCLQQFRAYQGLTLTQPGDS